MSKTPLFLLTKRLDRIPLQKRIETVVGLLKHEGPYTIRRRELEDYLKYQRTLQLRKERAA